MAISYIFNPFSGSLDAINSSSGTVTSVALSDNSTSPIYTVGGSPITTAGTLTVTLNSQTANTVFAGPNGSSGQPTFRSLVSSDIPNLASLYVTQSEVGTANGVASLDSSGKIPVGQLPSVTMEYQGSWNPSTNTPTLADGTGTNGNVYYVSVAFSGTIAGLTDPSMTNFQLGDLVIYSSSINKWQLVSPANGVQSVNGAQGAVVVNAINQLTGDVAAGPATASQSVSSTIQPNVVTNSKLAQMAGNTVKANITGSTANASDVALGTLTETISSVLVLSGWSDATIGSPTIQVQQATTATSGYLSSVDWNTFNNKQTSGNYITALTGDGAASGPGSSVLTLATVNSGPGSFGGASQSLSATVNGKGLITVLSAQSIQISETQVTNLTTDLASKATIVTGDIAYTNFSLANNQTSPANITGLSFASSIHGAEVQYAIVINATSSLYESGTLLLCNTNGPSWQLVQQTVGNSSGIVISITSTGQLQYTSSNYTGFSSATIYFRALVV